MSKVQRSPSASLTQAISFIARVSLRGNSAYIGNMRHLESKAEREVPRLPMRGTFKFGIDNNSK